MPSQYSHIWYTQTYWRYLKHEWNKRKLHGIKINLSPEVKQKLESRHKQVRDVRESDRIKAVLLSFED